MDDLFEVDRNDPTHQQRLAAEKKVNVYFIPGKGRNGNPRYAYVVSSALLHEEFVASIKKGVIPDFAVVVEEGEGIPPAEQIQRKMMEYYGFNPKEAASQ